MKKIILLKEDNPNKGTKIEVENKSDFFLNDLLEDPIGFLDNSGALGFTKAWATKSIDVLGGNDKDIQNSMRVTIFNQNAHMVQSWLIVQLKEKADTSTLNVYGQLYNILETNKKVD